MHNMLLLYSFTYLLYNQGSNTYEMVFSQRILCVPGSQGTLFTDSGRYIPPTAIPEGLVPAVTAKQCDTVDMVLQYLTSVVFSAFHILVKNSPLYVLRDEELCD